MSPIKLSVDDLVSITVLAQWTGFGVPSKKCNRLVINRSPANGFESFDAMDQLTSPIGEEGIEAFLNAVSLDCPRTEPTLFSRTQDELDFHFGACSTDDYPAMRLTLIINNGSAIAMSTNSNHAHLLPWVIRDPDERTSFNPQISIHLAELMPPDFIFRNRLRDSSVYFESDRLSRIEHAKMIAQHDSERSGEATDDAVARLNELFTRIVDEAANGEDVKYQGSQRPYSANQLRRLSDEQLIELVTDGFDLSTSDETGQTALMLAAFPPFNKEQFWKLVRAGADLNAHRSDGLTGLMLACAGGMEDVVGEWLLAGANVHVKGPKNTTALMLGATNGIIVSDLLAHGANASDQDEGGDTALDYALSDLNVMRAGNRLKSIELLTSQLTASSPEFLFRSYERAEDTSRRLKLEIAIEREFGGRPMSETIREAKSRRSSSSDQTRYFDDIDEFIDLEISELELADRIVEILRIATSQNR